MVEYIIENSLMKSLVSINGNKGQISLIKDTLILNYYYQSCDVNKKIALSDIVSISKDCVFSMNKRLIQFSKLLIKQLDNQEAFKFVIYSVIPRLKRPNQLDILSTVISFDTEHNCGQWFTLINKLLQKDESRPKSLAVFINPIGGFKKGVQLYTDKIHPIFELCGIKSQVTITKKRGEAEEFILSQSLFEVDGFICVGGDGMLMELVQGLLLKSRRDHGYSDEDHDLCSKEFPLSLRVGIIPAGSTDTVAYSTIGTKDPITAALQVVLGKSIGIDAISVHCDNRFIRYNVSLMGYGFYGNLVAESEAFRWMGPCRYDWLGFKNFMSLESYYGELKYIPLSNKYGEPNDGVYCIEKCSRCSKDLDLNQKSAHHQDWVTIRDRFIAINSFLLSCRCTKSPIGPAPFAHLGNGCTDLVIVRECSRVKFLQHLLRSASYEDHFDFDFVETVRVSEFSFTALPDSKVSSNNSIPKIQNYETPWNCDGEPLYCSNVHCKVHKQIIKLFASGIPSQSTNNTFPIKSPAKLGDNKIL